MLSATAMQHNPATLTWTKNLAIGHELIDKDHQHLMQLANRLRNDLLLDPEPEHSLVGEVLVELIEHTGGHFAREDALMLAIRFPAYEEHRRQHAMLMAKVDDLHRRFMEGSNGLPRDVYDFLQRALVPHILTSDMDLGRHLCRVNGQAGE